MRYFSRMVIAGMCIAVSAITVNAAEYTVQKGDVFGQIAQEIGYGENVNDLALFNNISTTTYTIRAGQVLRYVSTADLENAQKWVEERLHFLSSQDDERNDYERVFHDIRERSFEYNEDKKVSNLTFASEILILADAWEAR